MNENSSRRDNLFRENETGSFTWTPDFWREWTDGYHVSRSYVLSRITQSALALLRPSSGHHVLNVGCGYGREAQALTSQYPYVQLIGIDTSSSMIRSATDNLPQGFSAVQGSASQLPFDNDVFDGVLCVGVLMHIENEFAACREMIRVLKPGGRLILSFNSLLHHPLGLAAQWILSRRKKAVPGYKQVFRLPVTYARVIRQLGGRVRIRPGTFAMGNEPPALLRALIRTDRHLAPLIPWATFEPVLECEKRR